MELGIVLEPRMKPPIQLAVTALLVLMGIYALLAIPLTILCSAADNNVSCSVWFDRSYFRSRPIR